MKTVAELINGYNKQKSDSYHLIRICVKEEGKVPSFEEYYHVSNIKYVRIGDNDTYDNMLCFFGRRAGDIAERYMRIDHANIIKSEV